ncbi:hypothetical protein [Endozoicomonas euniceicola]|uniref:Death domain-containing protein n=1 Tax=Endozoicomonas euniceicola TaxID=1234143 RepID=A0ABY6H024_9GAMM|nr:hypothetical protein [Endozoicomonas euniceicola]UYM17593.1 hypothetical protein NX720_06695 [Endozoicomonas euniceicola]
MLKQRARFYYLFQNFLLCLFLAFNVCHANEVGGGLSLPKIDWYHYTQGKDLVKESYWVVKNLESESIPAFNEIKVSWSQVAESHNATGKAIRLCFQSTQYKRKPEPLHIDLDKEHGHRVEQEQNLSSDPIAITTTRLLYPGPETDTATLHYNSQHWQLKPDCPVFTTTDVNPVTPAKVTIRISRPVKTKLSRNLWAREVVAKEKPESYAASGGSDWGDDDFFHKRPGHSFFNPLYQWGLKWATVSVVPDPFGGVVKIVSPVIQLVINQNNGKSLSRDIPLSLWQRMLTNGHHLHPDLLRLLGEQNNPETVYENFLAERLAELFSYVHQELNIGPMSMKALQNSLYPHAVEIIPGHSPSPVGCPGGTQQTSSGVSGCSSSGGQYPNNPPSYEEATKENGSSGGSGDGGKGNGSNNNLCKSCGKTERYMAREYCKACLVRRSQAQRSQSTTPVAASLGQRVQLPEMQQQNTNNTFLYKSFLNLTADNVKALFGSTKNLNIAALAGFISTKIDTSNLNNLETLTNSFSKLMQTGDLKSFIIEITQFNPGLNGQEFKNFKYNSLAELLTEINKNFTVYFPENNNPENNNKELKSFLKNHLIVENIDQNNTSSTIDEKQLEEIFSEIKDRLFEPLSSRLHSQSIPIDQTTLDYLDDLSGKLFEYYNIHTFGNTFWGDYKSSSRFINKRPEVRISTLPQIDDRITDHPEEFKVMLISTLFLSDRLNLLNGDRVARDQYQQLKAFIAEMNRAAKQLFSDNRELKINMSYYLLVTCGITDAEPIPLNDKFSLLSVEQNQVPIRSAASADNSHTQIDPNKKLSGNTSTRDLIKWAKEINAQWIQLGKYLEFKEHEISNIQYDITIQRPEDKADRLLNDFSSRSGTFQTLVEALRDMKLNELAKKVEAVAKR